MNNTNQVSTDREIVGLKPQSSRYEVAISGAQGLAIRVSPNGERVFEFRYVAENGKRRRMRLGLYPDLKLADARIKAIQLRSAVISGTDPSGEKQAAKHLLRTGETVSELAEQYFAAAAKGMHGGRRRPKRARTVAHEKNLYERYAARRLGQEVFVQVRRIDIKSFMRDLTATSGLAPASLARVGEVLSSIFGFAVHTDRLETNPVAGLAHPLAMTSRDRRFDDNSLKTLWNTLVLHSGSRADGKAKARDPQSRLDPITCLATRFVMLTLCRRGEAGRATWDEIDFENKLWSIPRERIKSGRADVKPLSPEALAILKLTDAHSRTIGRGHRSKFIFPAPRNPKEPMREERMAMAIRRLCARLGIPHGSPHDFRRSGATTLTGERYGFTRFVVPKS
jgi:integrase